jgi:hypothetical protein
MMGYLGFDGFTSTFQVSFVSRCLRRRKRRRRRGTCLVGMYEHTCPEHSTTSLAPILGPLPRVAKKGIACCDMPLALGQALLHTDIQIPLA